MALAQETWDTESQGTKQYYFLQESIAKKAYDEKVAAAQDYEARQEEAVRGTASEGGEPVSFNGERERTEAERMEVDNAEGAGNSERDSSGGGAAGFTSING